MRSKIQKIGDELAIVLPREIVTNHAIQPGDELYLSETLEGRDGTRQRRRSRPGFVGTGFAYDAHALLRHLDQRLYRHKSRQVQSY